MSSRCAHDRGLLRVSAPLSAPVAGRVRAKVFPAHCLTAACGNQLFGLCRLRPTVIWIWNSGVELIEAALFHRQSGKLVLNNFVEWTRRHPRVAEIKVIGGEGCPYPPHAGTFSCTHNPDDAIFEWLMGSHCRVFLHSCLFVRLFLHNLPCRPRSRAARSIGGPERAPRIA